MVLTEQEWLRLGMEQGIIMSENLVSSDNKDDMNQNIENENIELKRSVTLRKDGRYMCHAQLSTGRKAVYGKTSEEAIRKAEKREEKDRFLISDNERYSFKVYYKKWFIAKMHTSIKPQTIDRIEIAYNKYYRGKFDTIDIRTLDESTIIDFAVKQVNENEKGYMTRKEYAKLMQIVKDVYMYYYDECVLTKCHMPSVITWETVKRKINEESTIKSPKKKEIALSETERKNMETLAMNEEKISNMVWALVNYTGLRLGEISALTWADIDLEEEVLFIDKTVCSYYLRDKEGNRIKHIYDIGSTKTAHSERGIPLTQNAINILERLRKIQEDNGWYKPKQLISYNGQKYKAQTTALSKELKELGESIGISTKRLHPHLLRKTVATVLHDAKMSTRDIADLLGHSDISTTEQCYIISTEVEKKRKKMAIAL